MASSGQSQFGHSTCHFVKFSYLTKTLKASNCRMLAWHKELTQRCSTCKAVTGRHWMCCIYSLLWHTEVLDFMYVWWQQDSHSKTTTSSQSSVLLCLFIATWHIPPKIWTIPRTEVSGSLTMPSHNLSRMGKNMFSSTHGIIPTLSHKMVPPTARLVILF